MNAQQRQTLLDESRLTAEEVRQQIVAGDAHYRAENYTTWFDSLARYRLLLELYRWESQITHLEKVTVTAE